MNDYLILSRKYRPQTFNEVIGQEVVVTTLQNAIKMGRHSQAYLFSGCRGTGKTTIARLLAKAWNCKNLTPDQEPCNVCKNCKEISISSSLDVIEIDGASNRGIENIRQLNETVTYSPSSGKYKVFLIDEVHMLTKEAFNALLKTLEEPPKHVKFLFATTEPHKVPATILSRCQHFRLNRIPAEKIVSKLKQMTKSLNITFEEAALYQIATRAQGALRDAESLLDQALAFCGDQLTNESLSVMLGIPSKDFMFALDMAGKNGDHLQAFHLAEKLYFQGTDLLQFLESLIEHLRTILWIQLSDNDQFTAYLTESEKKMYKESAKFYQRNQCLSLIDTLMTMHKDLHMISSEKMIIEHILLKVIQSHHRVSIDTLIHRLSELEQKISSTKHDSIQSLPIVDSPTKTVSPVNASTTHQTHTPESKPVKHPHSNDHSPNSPSNASETLIGEKTKPLESKSVKHPHSNDHSPNSPSNASETLTGDKAKPFESKTMTSPASIVDKDPKLFLQKKAAQDTILQFAAVELESVLQKNPNK